MSRTMHVSLWPSDVLGFVYNAVGNLHLGPDAAHSIATLHYFLRNDMMQEAKDWYRNWKRHIPQCELSHDQLMQLDDDYRIKHQAKQQILNMIDGDQLGTLLLSVLGKLVSGVGEQEPQPQPQAERNHHPRAKTTVG